MTMDLALLSAGLDGIDRGLDPGERGISQRPPRLPHTSSSARPTAMMANPRCRPARAAAAAARMRSW